MGYGRKEYLNRHKELCDKMLEITTAKNSDYTGDDKDPFKNFTLVEAFGVLTTEQGFFTRMMDKMARFSAFIRKGTLEVKDETVKDTLLDLANYCLLCICYLESKELNKNGKGK